MVGNRQNNKKMTVEKESDDTYGAYIKEREEGNSKQIWKWDEGMLVSKWNEDFVLDGTNSPYKVSKKSGTNYQNWRLVYSSKPLNHYFILAQIF